ncbi:hypothetical protein JCM8547_004996 [Rhodosporidiobolus lusitaniae]
MPHFSLEYKLERLARLSEQAVTEFLHEDDRPPSLLETTKAKDHPIPSRVGNFRLLVEHQLEVAPYTRIAKWQSEKSGLKVIWADTPGPISRFWATVNTEIFNSSGEPHTLEHLTFTSSQHYPFSGILDAVANRMLTQGSNAWTAVDNTTYTVESCSEEGLLQVIPVYLDHVLFPLMTPEVFKTEIYHVDGKGEEGGVVFSEMQGREGSQGDVMDRALAEILYNGKNGYRSETGGQLDALRKITLEDIEHYHSQAYAPQNITVVVTGQTIDPSNLLHTLNTTIEPAIVKAGLAKGPRPQKWLRPFVESSTARNPPILQRDVVKKVEYADSDESVGQINITWVGPPAHDWLTCAALDALGSYLSDGSSSPLSKLFVEIADPACSVIAFSSEFRDPTLLTAILGSVPSHRLPSLASEFYDALRQILREPFDTDRMETILKQQALGVLETLETAPAAYVQGSVSQDILYGKEDGSELRKVFADLKLNKKLRKFTADDWLDLLEMWFVERHSVTLIGTPSVALAASQSAANHARVSAFKSRLGPSGLAKLDADLERAKKANDHPAPASYLEKFKIPNIDALEWLTVETARSNGVGKGRDVFKGHLQEKINDDRGGELPYFVEFEHFESSFVSVSVFLHGPPTSIFPLFLNCFFAMPVHRADGTKLTFQEASRQLDKDTVSFSAQTLGEGLLVTIKTEKQFYENAIVWLSDTLYGTVYDEDRLRNLINTALQDLPDEKQDGSGIASSAMSSLIYNGGSFQTPINLLNRTKLYPALRQRVQHDAAEIIKELEEMRSQMLDPRAMRMKVTGDVYSLRRPVSAWLDHFEHIKPFPAGELAHVLRTRDLLTDLGKKPEKKAVIYTLSSSESSYLFAHAACPDWHSPDYPALHVATACLSNMNSFLWKAIRGPGLAYGASVGSSGDQDSLTFTIFKSPDAFAALEEGRKVVETIASGKVQIKQSDVDSARSGVVYNEVLGQHTPEEVANASFCNMLADRPTNFSQVFLKRVKHVTPSDVQKVIKKWVLPLFFPKSSIVTATTTQDQEDKLAGELQKLGYEVEKRSL